MDNKIIDSYDNSFASYGDDPRAVQWGNIETQYFRFKILTDMEFSYPENSVIFDYGCGKGDLFFYMLFHGFRGKYIGVDINQKLVNFAREKYEKYSQAEFFCIESEKDISRFDYDYAFISGLFNDQTKNNNARMKKILMPLYTQARRGIAFNAISSAAKKRVKNTAYFDPLEVTKFCLRKLSQFVTLRHDYRGGNFTMYLYKNRGTAF